MKELKEMNFCFENCETVTIPADMIETFTIGGITESISMNPFNKNMNKSTEVSNLYIRFKKNFKETTITTTCDTNAYERFVKWQDICYITLHDFENNEKTFGVIWPADSNSDYSNKRQTCSEAFDSLEIMVEQ